MNLNDHNHPLWKILRLAVVGVLMLALLHWNYKHGLVIKDIGTILVTLLGLAGYDFATQQATK